MDCTLNTLETKCPPKACYANNLRVGYNAFEFIFDFGQAFSGELEACSRTRIVTTPGYAKAMIMALQSALEEFELDFGRIEIDRNGTDDTNESISE